MTSALAEALERAAETAASVDADAGLELAVMAWARAAQRWQELAERAPNLHAGALENAERCWREAASVADRLADLCASRAEVQRVGGA